MLLKFAQLWSISSFRLVKPNLTQMHPNDFKLCMEEIEGYYHINEYYQFSYTFQILMQLSFYHRERRTKTLGKQC